MHNEIQDAFDLGWKRDAVMHGRGGPVLDSDDHERCPASRQAANEPLRNYHGLTSLPREVDIAADGATGEAALSRLGTHLDEDNEKAWHLIGVHLGYSYDPSPVLVLGGSPRPVDDTNAYVPPAGPGARTPQAWIGEGRSLLDLFGAGFTLLDIDGVSLSGLDDAAWLRNVSPVQYLIEDRDTQALYGQALVRLRPDGHVAWRGNARPHVCLGVIDTIRGAQPPVAAQRLNQNQGLIAA